VIEPERTSGPSNIADYTAAADPAGPDLSPINVERFVAGARAAGVPVRIAVWTGCGASPTWHIGSMAGATAAVRELGGFLSARLREPA
jgi:hypothetical protein